ncbi:type VI secretion system tip protein TssI/VgrG, partial [Paracoccus sp. (in: a-proteobacteria)]|uniref:type VI secretion system Vgr family protein n=1 Tax=Paracoccus sp. TaxID=267 RepID=UPI0028A0DD04
WFWLAGRRRNQRIFHNKTVVEIIQELLADYATLGDPALELALSGDYPVLEYTVQYRESDLDFARRQLERHGISFHFRHQEGSHTLVITDDASSHTHVGTREYKPYDAHHQADAEHFWEWAPERNLMTGAVRLTDYNFKTPMASMEVDRQGDAEHAQGLIESFDYPGDYSERGRGKDVVGLKTQTERGGDRRHRAAGDCISLGSGMQVTLAGDPVPGTGETYLVLSASYHFMSEAYGSGSPGADGYAFNAAWTMMPITAAMAPPRRTKIPVVQGPQTALVVGEGEIDCDEFGRILVRFHWDLANAISMRCRVSQSWAGAGWGGMVIPRIGMEVVVEFLEGDPDKPLVTGCVYNGKNTVPYDLPANKTVSTFKSDTHEGGGYNEFRFEDQAGREEVFLHAQRDHNTVIENDETHQIGHDRAKSVGNDQSESIGHDKSISVGHDHSETIGNDVIYQVGRNQQENYGKDHIHRVGNIHKQAIFADHLYETGRNFEGQVFGRYTLDVGNSITNNTRSHTLMAYEKMQIKGPGGKITIDASGITLEAATIWLKGNVIMGGGGAAQVPTLKMAAHEGLPLCEECAPQEDDA